MHQLFMLLLTIWAAFNVVLFLDLRFTGWQQRKYYRTTKRFKSEEFPKAALILSFYKHGQIANYAYLIFIIPALLATLCMALVLALIASIYENINDQLNYFLKWW